MRQAQQPFENFVNTGIRVKTKQPWMQNALKVFAETSMYIFIIFIPAQENAIVWDFSLWVDVPCLLAHLGNHAILTLQMH